jgi:hypothetical protein
MARLVWNLIKNKWILIMSETIKSLKICAFCPNTCRSSFGATEVLQIESQTPSALSFICLAVHQGNLDWNQETQDVLMRRDAVKSSVGKCTYGLNMTKILDDAVSSLNLR